ncbi:hypothetical protein J6590_048636 [Homalodisca vitripennis]|nr:hypothetical protein J6590_048636 [Homalodisca vitripennis]
MALNHNSSTTKDLQSPHATIPQAAYNRRPQRLNFGKQHCSFIVIIQCWNPVNKCFLRLAFVNEPFIDLRFHSPVTTVTARTNSPRVTASSRRDVHTLRRCMYMLMHHVLHGIRMTAALPLAKGVQHDRKTDLSPHSLSTKAK